MAEALHLTVSNVKVTMHRLRRLDLARICPECFSDRLFNGVCEACGFEPPAPSLPAEIRIDEQSPTNHIHAGNALGSELNYSAVGFNNHGIVVKHWIDRILDDSLTKDVKSHVMEELKRYYPDEVITDYAGKLVIKEVTEFRARYPLLATSKNVRRQLTLNVIRRLQFLYPYIIRSGMQQEVTSLQ